MRIRYLTAAFVLTFATLLTFAHPAYADDCWVVKKMRCETALSSENYKFDNDGFMEGMTLICFTQDGGTASGDDLKLFRLGDSTLIGFGQNGRGMETVGTYQIDRQHHKLSYTATRIGTDTLTPVLSDRIAACIGDAKPVPSHK